MIGDAILYTPDADYAGPDSFTYCITDNNGGTDFAQVAVAIEAVADVPDLDVQVLAGDVVNEIRFIVTATQTDADSSEYIDRILTSALPDGVTIDLISETQGTELDEIVQEYVLTLPLDQDTDFDLTFTAVSKETSNGDEETASQTIEIAYEYNLNQYNPEFLATNQSIWDSGGAFIFEDNRFIGVQTSVDSTGSAGGGLLAYDVHIDLTAGFQSHLTIGGGEIDASLPYDISIGTNYNKTTDMLVIDSSAFLTGGGFTTEGPGASYDLDFIFNYFLDVYAAVDPPGVDPIEILDIVRGSNNTFNIIDLELSDLVLEIPLGGGFSLMLGWPDIDTTSDSNPEPGVYVGSGEGNNFLQLNLDMDQFLFFLAGSPVSPFEFHFDYLAGTVFADIELVDLDLFAGLNALQEFTMEVQGLSGTLTFEDGSTQGFMFGEDIAISNASTLDLDNDGIEFNLSLDPDVELTNDTDIGVNLGFDFLIALLSVGYDFGFGITDSVSIALYNPPAVVLPVASFDVYDNTFDLAFDSQDLMFTA